MRRDKYCLALTLAVLGSGFITLVSAQFSNATFIQFQTCAGLPANRSEINVEHNRLKGLTDEAFDLYSFLRSSGQLQPILDLIPGLSFNASDNRLHDVNFTRVWFHIKLLPRLASASQQDLSCLSARNFTCQTYQALVSELNLHIQRMDPARQRMVYMFFMRPFLERNDTEGCINHGSSSEEWLTQNFRSFSSFARLRDFTALNMNFSGLAALQLLSPEQKAEFILNAHDRGLGNNTVNLVLESLLRSLLNCEHLNQSMSFLRPLGRFVRTFVSNIQQVKESSVSRHTLVRAIVNWTLSELAGHFSHSFTLGNETIVGQTPSFSTFNISSMESWFQHVVLPVLKCFLPHNQTEIPQNLTAVFYHVFFLNSDMSFNSSDSMDVCQARHNNGLCSVSHTIEKLSEVLRCVTHCNMTFTRDNLKTVVTGLSRTLDESLPQHLMMNDSSGPSNLTDLFGQLPANSFSPEELGNPDFIRFWFLIKLQPLLPIVSEQYLSCLSTQSFSCHAYQALVMGLSDHISSMNDMRQRLVYTHFIHPFLSHCRHSDMMNCTSRENSSLDTIERNYGRFSVFAPLQHFFDLHRNFSALEALPALSPRQIADLVLMPHTPPPQRVDIINRVFDHLHNDTRLRDFLSHLQMGARGVNLSCESYNTIFSRLDRAISSSPPGLDAVFLRNSKDSLMRISPDECARVALQIGCSVTPVNKSQICDGVNTTTLQQDLPMPCNYSIQQYACLSQQSQLRPGHISDLLRCTLSSNMTYTKETWKLFFSEFSGNLDEAFHLFSNMSNLLRGPFLSLVLDVLGEVRVFSPQDLRNPHVIQTWFKGNLRPFLPHASREFLSCLSTKDFSCGTFQIIVEALGDQSDMDWNRQQIIYSVFIKAFLSRNDTEDPSCVNHSTNSTDWLNRYFGPFRHFAPISVLRRLNRNFSVMDVLPLLSPRQLAEVATTPGQLRDPGIVNIILIHVPPRDLGEFFDIVSPAVQGLHLPLDVCSELLHQVFDRANLSEPSINDTEVLVWLDQRLRPLLHNLTTEQVAPLFNIVRHRACNTSQEIVELLNSIQHTLSADTQNAVQHQILMSLRGSTPLRCYRNDSFFLFLKRSFLDFPFPRLNNFLSLIPPRRESEIINSVRPSELGSFLRQPEVVDNETELCTIFYNFNRTPEFLEKEEIPASVRRVVLPCVWPLALSVEDEAEVDRWFDSRLRNYLKFLNRDLLNSSDTLNASCLPFRKLVSVLGANFTNSSGFTQEDAYNTIKTYLNTDSAPKCYSPSEPKLNSTAWFVHYIGVFITFVTLDDLDTFGSESTLQQFAVDPVNIQLFTFSGVPQNLAERYTQLIFLQNPNFSPFQLPPPLQCGVPGSVYTSLSEADSVTVLGNLNQSCTDVDPEISSALASNIQTVSTGVISALGQESTGLSPAQITVAPPSVIVQSLQTLSSASGWNLGQSFAIIRVLISGNFQINTASSLVQLGSLIGGLPSRTITSIPSSEILTTVSNPTFVTNMLSAPTIVQQTYVNKIISLNTAPQQLLINVPDNLATQIPRNLLQFPTSGLNTVVLQRINKKRWSSEQAVLFFGTIANGFSDPDQLSEDVLQGFTCTRVRRFSKRKIKRLIRACRRRGGRRKVVLKETQLTCMYNNIRDESPQDFVNYPSDMLLYYNYANIPQANCRSYFTETGRADFSVFSKTLDGRKVAMWNNARSCLGITGTQISRQNVKVLGNLCCTLDQNYIQNSDSSILDRLKNCKDFSDQQIIAMENVLINGNTKYGPPARWNENTLRRLDILPLYLRENFWMRFRKRDKRRFLKKFMRRLRRGKTQKRKLKKLFRALRRSLRSKREAVNGCPDTLGNITHVTISDDAFPFGYDASSFNHCLSTQVVKDNLASLTEKVDDDDFQLVVLEKLHQAYPEGLSDQQVQLLGSVSRMASVEQIDQWNITSLDTLAALMDSSDGDWDPAKNRVILTKYLSIPGNTLGTSELNSVGGPNLCSLDTGVLQGINNDSLRDANSLDITNCSTEHKKTFFSVAKVAFPISFTNRNTDVITTYQLIEPYLGGADSSYIQGLATSNVSMTIATFIDLDESVVLKLTVSQVEGLLGSNLVDLKTFENNSVVQSWVSRQLQDELDALHINLTGGRESTVTVSPNLGTNTTNSGNPATMVSVVTTTTTTTSGQPKGTYPVPLLSVLTALFVTMQTWGPWISNI